VTAGDAQRLFFALWPPEDLQAALAGEARRALAGHRGRPVPAANLHITLAFLGATAPADRACYERAADTLAGRPGFSLVLDHLAFHRRRGMLWARPAEAPQALLDLARALGDALAACGRAPEQRPFRAHVTLAREAAGLPRTQPMTPRTWPVSRFVLVASEPGPGGVEYRLLRSWALGDSA
jgi:2'-5' RNA ligase